MTDVVAILISGIGAVMVGLGAIVVVWFFTRKTD